MATLFNLELLEIDFEILKQNFISSNMASTIEEQAIVNALYSIQTEEVALIDIAESYVEEIIANSTNDIYASMSKVISSGRPSVEISNGILNPVGLENTYGAVTQQTTLNNYYNYYWKMGDYVEVNNYPVVPISATTSIDAVMTRDIMYGYFLIDIPNETLTRCRTSTIIGGDIRNSSIEGDRAFHYGDASLYFFKKTDSIDVVIKDIKTPHVFMNSTQINLFSVSAPSRIDISSMKSSSGVISLEFLNENFLKKYGYILNDSFLPYTSETNTIVHIDGIINFQETCAPKKDWTVDDLIKTDKKSDTFIDNMVNDIVAGISPTESREYGSVVRMDELSDSINKTMEIIRNIGVCNDS